MSPSESDLFLRRLMIAYPGLGQWVHEYSPAPSETVAMWKTGLNDIAIDEANRVLEKWIDGTFADAPVGFERERFLANLKSHVRTFRAESRRQEIARNTHQEISHRDSEPTRKPDLGPLYAQMRAQMASGDPSSASEIANRLYFNALATSANQTT